MQFHIFFRQNRIDSTRQAQNQSISNSPIFSSIGKQIFIKNAKTNTIT